MSAKARRLAADELADSATAAAVALHLGDPGGDAFLDRARDTSGVRAVDRGRRMQMLWMSTKLRS